MVEKNIDLHNVSVAELAQELYNRLGDYIYDPEPRSEPLFEDNNIRNLELLREALDINIEIHNEAEDERLAEDSDGKQADT